MANQLVGTPNMALIADLLADRTFDFYCMVDHPDNVADLGAYFASRGVKLNVMIEYGVVGGRCGCRSEQEVAPGQSHQRATGAGPDRHRRLRRGDSR
jgi:D-serine deaminase-like pyridoxal phosphate-dependent protein